MRSTLSARAPVWADEPQPPPGPGRRAPHRHRGASTAGGFPSSAPRRGHGLHAVQPVRAQAMNPHRWHGGFAHAVDPVVAVRRVKPWGRVRLARLDDDFTGSKQLATTDHCRALRYALGIRHMVSAPCHVGRPHRAGLKSNSSPASAGKGSATSSASSTYASALLFCTVCRNRTSPVAVRSSSLVRLSFRRLS